MKGFFRSVPKYLHVLACAAFLVGLVVGESSPVLHPLLGALATGLIFTAVVYLFPFVLVIPDAIDMLITAAYRKFRPDPPVDETGFVEVELNSKGRVTCPICGFKLVHVGRLMFCRCGAKLRVNEEHNK